MNIQIVLLIICGVIAVELQILLILLLTIKSKLERMEKDQNKQNASIAASITSFNEGAQLRTNLQNQNPQIAKEAFQMSSQQVFMQQQQPQMQEQPQVWQEAKGQVICSKCYHSVPVAGKFCPKCGATLADGGNQ